MARPSGNIHHLIDKYKELAWALSMQGYNNEEVGVILNRSRSVILRIIAEKPKDWTPKWVKVK